MRIVLYVSQLANLTGGEVNARDWALGFKARGHKVAVYTPVPGALAASVRKAGIVVVDDPALLNDRPDILFGSGVNEIVTLIARFPEVPAIQISQQWDEWAAFPCLLPQVALYMAVDEINMEMLVNEFGVAPSKVRLMHNAVDLARIPPRPRPLPVRPAHALLFAKSATHYVDAVRAACEARGVSLECVGYGVDRAIDDPLAAMAQYDLVIGSARLAIEAAAAGAAVLVADHRGLAGLLTTSNLDRFRAHNFGREVLRHPLDAARIGAEIDLYDRDDAARVSAAIRASASLEGQLETIERLFAEAIALSKQVPVAPDDRRKALATYLSRHLPRFGEAAPRHVQFQAVAEGSDAADQEPSATSGPEPDDASRATVRNLLPGADALDEVLRGGSIARVARNRKLFVRNKAYRLEAIGGESEHYAVATVPALHGEAVASIEARPETASRLRLQLLDGAPRGAYVDFDFSAERPGIGAIGTACRARGGAILSDDGWFRLWVTANFRADGGPVRCIVQLVGARGAYAFPARGESILIRRLKLEYGRHPSP